MSDTEPRPVPKGSYAAGRTVLLPDGAESPIEVYVNGMAQTEGVDFNLEGNEVHFTRDLLKEELGSMRKLAMFVGFFGTYRDHDTVDIHFTRNGRTELVSDLPIQK